MITLEQLALRRRYTAVAAKRHTPRKIPAPKLPRALVIEYTRQMLALSRAMDRVIVQELQAERVIRMDRKSHIPEPPLLPPLPSQRERFVRTVRAKFAKMTAAMGDAVSAMAEKVKHWTGIQWGTQLKAAVGIEQAPPVDMVPLMREFRARNISLISSLSEDKLARARTVLESITPESQPTGVALQLQAQADITESRAALIARDQIYTLSAQMTRERHEAAGVREFVWTTMHDDRVRPSHAEVDGQTFSYSNPPVLDDGPALPGIPINCRCLAAPSFGKTLLSPYLAA